MRNLDLLKMAIKMPDSISAEKEEIDEQEWSLIISGAEDALNKRENYRKDEGKALYSDFSNRLNNIKSLLKNAVEIDPERIKKVRERLTKSVLELNNVKEKHGIFITTSTFSPRCKAAAGNIKLINGDELKEWEKKVNGTKYKKMFLQALLIGGVATIAIEVYLNNGGVGGIM